MNIVSLQFSLIFRPKLGEDQKKRSSLKFSPFFLDAGEKQRSSPTICVLKPSARLTRGGGGGIPQFRILIYANYTILATQKRGHDPMAPPKYAPD